MKPMLLTFATDIPIGEEWLYEAKYDGYRCELEWVDVPVLKSRNGKVLNHHFPEIIDFCMRIEKKVKPFLPISLDGEIVHLLNNFQSDFSVVQKRGRMRSEGTIQKHAKRFPCQYVVFDLLNYDGENLMTFPLVKRKEVLQDLWKKINLPMNVHYEDAHLLKVIDVFQDSEILWQKIVSLNGEGLVAKRENSKWISDIRSNNWLKIKNWRYVNVILRRFDKENGFFSGAVYHEDTLVDVVSFRHGLKEEEFNVLMSLFQKNGEKLSETVWEISPSICVDIACIDFHGEKLREPRFHRFRLDVQPEECNWQRMLRQLQPIPESVNVTHPDRLVWPDMQVTKDYYLYYLQSVAPYMLPFLRKRALTVIRYPQGVSGEGFYQKSSPEHIPNYVETKLVEGTNFVLCNNIETLLWLGNQLALEWHIPFQTIQTTKPTEIVFDLDPPSVQAFSLAIEAALRMKVIFDQFDLHSFIKTSGGKGMQIYIPLPIDIFSYEETRIFMEFVCHFLCEQEPNWFTVERLKKNRGQRLYLDYVQHAEGKTIIAPYSLRGNAQGLVATPLYWEEVSSVLRPEQFSMPVVLERIKDKGNPFQIFNEAREENNLRFSKVLEQLKELRK